MPAFINSPLDIIRRHKAPRRPRLHARWGDVSITTPIDGAWSQFDNPHLKGKKRYGPGFVPGVSRVGGVSPIKEDESKEVLLLDSEDWTSDDDCIDQEKKEKTTTSKARRLTRILLPSSVNTQSNTKKVDEKEDTKEKEKPVEFQYKPINPDYAQEVAEQRDIESRPHFRYVPASRSYYPELQHDTTQEEKAGDETTAAETESNRKRSSKEKLPVRSQSCEPRVGGGGGSSNSAVLVTERRKPRLRTDKQDHTSPSTSTSSSPKALPLGTISRKSTSPLTSTSSRNNSISGGETLPNSTPRARDQSRGRIRQSQAAPQRSQSAVNKTHRRRTMTLDMVGDSEDLW